MDWGLGNPNKTAALIAMLMVAVWPMALVRKFGFWMALAIFALLGGCLVHTMSRGGVLAAFLGVAPVCVLFFPSLSRIRKLAGAITILLLVGFAWSLKADHRFVQGMVKEDESITNRLEIWKMAPRMMVDAPGGWGLGRAGDAYMQWYQPVNKAEGYRTLVNSHLTWLVETNWAVRFLYLAMWCSIFLVCWPSGRDVVLACAFGVWLSFATSALFSSVAESWLLWIVQLLFFSVAIVRRAHLRLPPPLPWLAPTGGLLACISLWIIGSLNPLKTVIKKSGDSVTAGAGDTKIGIVIDSAIVGATYGKAWRREVLPEFSATFVNLASDLRPGLQAVVLGGKQTREELQALRRMQPEVPHEIFLNPAFAPGDADFLEINERVRVVFGAFSPAHFQEQWDRVSLVRETPGATYLANWPKIVLDEID